MGRRTRVVAALVTGVLSLALAMPPAAAGITPTTVADRAGDGVGAGDLLDLRIFQTETGLGNVVLQVRTQQPINLTNNVAFKKPTAKSELRFNISTDNDPAFEAVILVRPSPTGAQATLRSFAPLRPEGLCANAVELSQVTPKSIRVAVPLACIGLPPTVRASARYRLDFVGNGTVDSDDRVPNVARYSPPYAIQS